MKRRTRDLVLSAVIFGGILLCAGWPHRAVALAFSTLYCPMANLAMSHHRFGRGGHVRWSPLREIAWRPGDNVASDAVLALSLEGVAGEMPLGICLRRDVYLPWLILVALLAAIPLSRRARACYLALSVPLVFLTSVGAYGLLIRWTLMTQVKGVYPLSSTGIWLTDFAYGALLAPPANRFIAPLALVALAFAFTTARQPGHGGEVRGDVR